MGVTKRTLGGSKGYLRQQARKRHDRLRRQRGKA